MESKAAPTTVLKIPTSSFAPLASKTTPKIEKNPVAKKNQPATFLGPEISPNEITPKAYPGSPFI
jgi:hypothetical protein